MCSREISPGRAFGVLPRRNLAVRTGKRRCLRATRFDSPPVIDGKLDDPVWANCKEFGDFRLLDTSDQPKPVSEKTSFRMGYDKGCLYVAIRCQESAMDRLAVSAMPQPETRDGPIEDQDVVHIMLASPNWRNEEYAHVCANAAGEIVDTLMRWEPGHVGWYHFKATLEGLRVKSGP